MPYNELIESRIENLIKDWKPIEKKKMFGGICYLINGNMCFGIYKDYLIVRMDKELSEERLKEKHVKPFDITGKPMKGWLMVEKNGWKKETDLADWLAIGRQFALTLPKK